MQIKKVKLDRRKVNKAPTESWWDPKNQKDAHNIMVQQIKAIKTNQKEQYYQHIRHAYLYNNKHNPLLGNISTLPPMYTVAYNVVKSCIDTVAAKIAKNFPRPRIVTEQGDENQRLRAKKLTQYLDGFFLDAKTYRQGVFSFKDAGIFGTGCIKVVPDLDNKCLRTERVLLTELVVDDMEGAYGDPKSLYQCKYVAKSVLIEMFPKFEAQINAISDDDINSQAIEPTTDMVKVYEGWHLGKNGRHIIAIDGTSLENEPWIDDGFPFAFMPYTTSVAGFFGTGIAEELMGTQLEINKLLRDIQLAQHLIAVPRVLKEFNSKVNTSHLNDEIGSVISYQGVKPDFFTPTAMNSEIYNHVKWLIQTAYEKVGVSQLSAASKKPAGLDSGKALRDYQDIESERFALTEEYYKEFFLDIAALVIKYSKKMYKNGVDLAIKVDGGKFIETINWSDVDMEDDKFVMKMYSASLFPTQPAAKIQQAEEYVRSGWMTRETAIRLMDMPDIEAWETEETAVQTYVEKAIADILASAKFNPPEPELIDAEGSAVNRMKKAYIDALTNNVSQEKTELMLRWIEMAVSILAPATPALAPIVPEAAPAQAAPLPLPQTGLLPQV